MIGEGGERNITRQKRGVVGGENSTGKKKYHLHKVQLSGKAFLFNCL